MQPGLIALYDEVSVLDIVQDIRIQENLRGCYVKIIVIEYRVDLGDVFFIVNRFVFLDIKLKINGQ